MLISYRLNIYSGFRFYYFSWCTFQLVWWCIFQLVYTMKAEVRVVSSPDFSVRLIAKGKRATLAVEN